LLLCCTCGILWAQEAESGFDLRTSLSGGAFYTHRLKAAPRSASATTGGFRGMLYPTWKLNENWTVFGAVQVHSRPYYYEQFSTQGYGVKADVLQAHLTYARFWKDGAIVVRAGELSSAFGSFLLRYDDADNLLIDIPLAYGYYYKNVTTLGLAGAEVGVTAGKLDFRAQFANSSPANRRSVFDREQYGSWTGGAGYAIRQGFRVGISAYRGAYLHRQHQFYRPGEAKPRDLPASAYGIDVQWGRGPWTANGELQRFQRAYRAVPTMNQHVGYAEVRRVLHPRWYVAGRAGYLRSSSFAGREAYEFVAGFRPNRHQLVKAGYQAQHGPTIRGTLSNTVALQLVTTFTVVSIAGE
jgi:hypothetical protein